ncbi:dihydroorotate dehydrogenase B catalytic subunit [Thermoplasmatales archaeon ex4572_165]|nr:MAG: dihydroorotate dehydrogenase B catalytic subunit [Thermoplasmatales archaeon ex4572_165]RLF57987.1 MAG: dihydroorotate dehydrogenase [Thermoplasmata archaeon]
MVSLTTCINNLELKNPFILASGIMDEDAGSMKRILQEDAAAVVTKSIGLHERNGHSNPTFLELEHGLLNAMGLPNPGIDSYGSEIKKINNDNGKIIGSIFGSNVEEFEILSEKMQNYGVNALELNLSCPHAKGYGLEIGQDPEEINKIVRAVKQSVSIPIFVKLSPNVNDICMLAKAAEQGGADAIVAINTVKAMKIDIETKRPILANKIGGYSGKAIKPIGIRNVYEIFEAIKIPIIGVGGITKGEDVIEYIMAGASAVQVGSGIYYNGIQIFTQLKEQVIKWMTQNNYQNIKELIGVAHK